MKNAKDTVVDLTETVAAPVSRLSPARQRLADHFAEIHAARLAVDEARQPLTRLSDTSKAVSEAQAALSAIEAEEASDFMIWASGGGEMPASRHAERDEVLKRLASARALDQAAERARQTFQEKANAASCRLQELEQQTDNYIRDIIRVDAQALTQRRRALMQELHAIERAMRGLLLCCGIKQDRDPSWATYGGRLNQIMNLNETLRVQQHHIGAASRQWESYVAQLRENPETTLEVNS